MPARNTTDATFARAVQLHQQGRLSEAESLYDTVRRQQPRHADALHYLGVIAHQRGRQDSAVSLIRESLAIRPRNAGAQSNLGLALLALGQHGEALAAFDRALALKSAYPEALSNRAMALHGLGRFGEALAGCERALALRPDYVDALNHAGLALQALDRQEDAIARFDQALALEPERAAVHANRGMALQALNRLDEALAGFARAIECQPDFANAHWNTALVRLLQGDFARGWADYEWRWQTDERRRFRRQFSQPPWQGEDLHGRTILVHAEQGLGDTLQFARYAPLVAARGGRVLLEVQPALVKLMASLAGVDQVVAAGDPLPPFQCHCPLLSLPRVFGTRLDTIPASVPYLAAPVGAVARWQEILGLPARPRVGLVWSGNPAHPNDRRRSIPLAALAALATAGVDLVSLQKDLSTSDRELLAQQPGVRELGSRLSDFADTAGLMAHLDLVITVDTAPAHLAGALGRPVWILLPFAPDFRWLLERTDNPWYPTARLFRQPCIGDWQTVLGRVAAALGALAPAPRP